MTKDELHHLSLLRDAIKRLERKVDNFARRPSNRKWEAGRRNAHLRSEVKQLKLDKIALVNYIKELEKFNKLDMPELNK